MMKPNKWDRPLEIAWCISAGFLILTLVMLIILQVVMFLEG